MCHGTREGLGAKRESIGDRVRDAHLRRRRSRQPREVSEQLGEAQVLAPEDVLLAYATAFRSEQMSARAVLDANKIPEREASAP